MSKAKFRLPTKLKENVRAQSLNIVYQVLVKQGYSNLLIKQSPVKEIDRNLLAEIVYGTISEYYTLDYELQPFIKNKKLDDWVHLLLLTSLFQMTRLDRVPAHAVINESVEIAKQIGNVGIGKFVNGVLRNIQRQGVRTVADITDERERLHIEASLPLWIIDKLTAAYGAQEVAKLAKSLKEPSKVSARIVELGADREVMLKQLQAENYEVVASQVSPYGIVGQKGFLAGSKLFNEGKLTIQDESSMLVGPAMALAPHHKVLDACAAPGGKTTHMASYLNKEAGGEIVALDIHEHKLKLIQDNAKRMQQQELIQTKLLDARKAQSELQLESFDRILVDAPCSGFGLMRRKPEIKYTKTAQDIQKLATIQMEILNEVAPLLKVGGKLIYSTCTIMPDENKQVVTQFLEDHPEFEKVQVPGLEHLTKANDDGMCVLLPHMYHTDGFFICCLQKKGAN